ncbi:MAG: hypothetical protein JXR59_05995 [Desulfuromonadaceae bacterium]|nr:hypothetical protein [Desulfuromonadaceae bacterium]
MEKKEYLSLAQASQQMQTTELHVLMHLKRGFLDGVEQDGSWYVSRESLERLLNKEAPEKETVIHCKSHCGRGCGGGCH